MDTTVRGIPLLVTSQNIKKNNGGWILHVFWELCIPKSIVPKINCTPTCSLVIKHLSMKCPIHSLPMFRWGIVEHSSNFSGDFVHSYVKKKKINFFKSNSSYQLHSHPWLNLLLLPLKFTVIQIPISSPYIPYP